MKVPSISFIFILIVVFSLNGIVTAEQSGGNRLALVIGVGDYKELDDNPYNQISPPNVNDVLMHDCEFDQVLMLTENQATKASIKAKINQLASKSTPSSIVVFYFIGHGDYYSGKSYICPYNSLLENYENDISDTDLKTWLDRVPAKNILVIIDACESGAFSPNSLNKLGTISKESLKKTDETLDPEQFIEQFGRTFTGIQDTSPIQSDTFSPNPALKGSRYTVMMAALSNQDSYATNVHGGILTYYLLQGLRSSSTDTNMDDWVSAEEAFRYAAPKAVSTASSFQYTQTPRMYDGDTSHDILLAGESGQGTISLTSTPSGATVYLDSVYKGVTPVTLTGIPSGDHQIKLTLSNYQDYTTNVIVTAGTTKYITAPLSQTSGDSWGRSGGRSFSRGVSTRIPIRR
jgi:hypothetical protein